MDKWLKNRKCLLILIGFLSSILASRLVVFFIEHHIGDFLFKYDVVHGYHIHHFSYGILILLASGFISLFIDNRSDKFWLFLIFGVGSGLVIDEFAIWIRLDASYHQLASIIAIITITSFLLIASFVEHEIGKKL